MDIQLSDDKHRFVQDSSNNALEIRDNVWDKIQSEKKSENLFSLTKFVTEFGLGLDFVSDWILSRILSQITYSSCISYAII